MIALGLVTSRSIIVTHSCMALQRRTSADSSVSERSRASCASSCMELQFKTIAQTLTLASSPAEDNIQDRSRNIQRANFRRAILSPQSAGQLHTSRSLRSEGQHLLRIPFRKSAAASRSFAFAAPTVWNSLNSSTREATGIGTFKTRLKTELFLSAFQ